MSFSLRAILGLDYGGFESGLLLSERAAKESGRKIKENLRGGAGESIFGMTGEDLIGGAAVAYVGDKIKEGFEAALSRAHELRAVSMDIGSNVQNIQVYEEAFGGTEKLTLAFKSLAEARKHVMAGDVESAKFISDFARLGVSADDIKSKSVDTLFQQIGESIKGASIDGDELASVSEVLGRSGVQMIDGFKRGVADLHDEMAKKGDLLSAQDLASLEQAHRELDSMERSFFNFSSKFILGWKQVISVLSGTHNDAIVRQLTANQAYEQIKATEAANKKAAQDAADAAHEDSAHLVAAIEEKTAELQYRALSNDEKRAVLAKQRATLEAQIAHNNYAAITTDAGKVRQAELNLQLEQVKLEQSQLKEDKPEKVAKEKTEKLDANAAQRVGAYVYEPHTADLQRRTVDHLSKIQQGIDKLVAKEGMHF